MFIETKICFDNLKLDVFGQFCWLLLCFVSTLVMYEYQYLLCNVLKTVLGFFKLFN